MSKSLNRVRAELESLGIEYELKEVNASARTASLAAAAIGCKVSQIVKSIVLSGELTDQTFIFLTAGDRRIALDEAVVLAGERLVRASADEVRKKTGFSIGGVAPIAHLGQVDTFLDKNLLDHSKVWAAAGTPRHVFQVNTRVLAEITNAKLADFSR